jgi:hypothetical protein
MSFCNIQSIQASLVCHQVLHHAGAIDCVQTYFSLIAINCA